LREVGLLEDSHGLVRTGRFNDTIAAVAKELHDGHADQDVVIKDEHGPTVGRLAVAVGHRHADSALLTSYRGVVAR
jgi:hypothetical protein